MNEPSRTDTRSRPRGPAQPAPRVVAKHAGLDWPEDERCFYLLARGGLYLCRNHEFFRSCVPAQRGPGQLEEQEVFLLPKFPLIPRALFEQSVGFFSEIADLHGSESALLLYWDRQERCVRLHAPVQTATVSRYSDGLVSPIGVHYEPPTDLPDHWVPFGDLHCHVQFSAYASGVDKDDELHSAGLHIVVGRIRQEPPDIHVEAVVDGERFRVDARHVIEDYRQRDASSIPREWIERVKVEEARYHGWHGGAS